MNLEQAKAHAKKRIKSGELSSDVFAFKALLDNNNTQELSDDLLSRLIRLCHPDKHDGSEMSIKVTQQLLEIKKGR